MMTAIYLRQKTQKYIQLVGFYVAVLVLPGCPPDVVWAARHFDRPYWVSDGQSSSLRFLSFFLFHITLTTTPIGLFLKFIATLPLGRNTASDATETRKLDALTQVFGTWYCPAVVFLGTAAILLNLISIATAFSVVGKRNRPRLTRRLLRVIGAIALLQVILGAAAVALSYPETWLREQQDWQAWRDIPRLGVYVGGFEIASWFVLVYGIVRLLGANALIGPSTIFRPPLQYEPTWIQDAKSYHQPNGALNLPDQQGGEVGILARHFAEQLRQIRPPNAVTPPLGTSFPAPAKRHKAKKDKVHSMTFHPDTKYWTGIPATGTWKSSSAVGAADQSGGTIDKLHQGATTFLSELGRGITFIRKLGGDARLVSTSGLLVVSVPLFLLSVGTQIACYVITRQTGRQCGW